MTATSVTDGRSARAARTRAAVVEALLDLNDEGNLRPTAREIAERAGVSLRSLYVHFDDLEDLFLAASERHTERVLQLVRPLPQDGPLEPRLDAFVGQRARIHERSSGVRRAALLQEPFSPALANVLAGARKIGRAEIERVFAPELEPCSPAERSRLVVELDVVANASTWDTLRFQHKLSVSAARDTVLAMLRAVLRGA